MKLEFTTCALVLVTALLTVSTPFASAEVVYRWNDERGNQVNSDRPPPEGIEYETISTSSSMVHAVDTEQPKAAAAEAKPQGDKAAEQVDPGKPKVEKNPEYCKTAKDNLSALDSNVRIQMRNDKGEVHYLTMEERDAQRKQALDNIKAYCG